MQKTYELYKVPKWCYGQKLPNLSVSLSVFIVGLSISGYCQSVGIVGLWVLLVRGYCRSVGSVKIFYHEKIWSFWLEKCPRPTDKFGGIWYRRVYFCIIWYGMTCYNL